jgi:hypothetical protein
MPPHPLALDPFGLSVSAFAAGVAVLYLADGLLGAPATRRRAWLAVAAGALVVAPTLFVVWSGIRTGVVRAQDDWTARVVEPAPAVEAWSTSFRREPPGPVIATPEPATPTRRAPIKDPRLLTLAAAGLAAWLLARLSPPGAGLVVLAGSMLSPAMAVAVVFGSPQPVVLAGMAGAALLARGGGTVLMRVLGGGVLAALLATLVAGGPGWSEIGPGLGLFNIFLYWGVEEPTAPIGLTLSAMGIAAAAALAWRLRTPDFAVAAAAWLMALWFWPSVSAHAVAVPLALITLAAVPTDRDSPPVVASTGRPPLP